MFSARSLRLLAGLLPVMRRPVQFSYRVTVLATQTTTPKLTFAAGYPPAFVDWGDGSARAAVTSGTELTHTYGTSGTYTVRLVMPQQAKWLTQIDISVDKVKSVLTPIQRFPALTLFYGYTNGAWIQNISGWVLLPALVSFAVQATFTIAPPNLSSMVAIQAIFVHNSALSQAMVDLYLSRCVAREASTTYATPALNVSGSNAAPSAQGVTDKNTLVAAGWVVTVTP